MKKLFIFFLSVGILQSAFGQRLSLTYKKEFRVITDNDAYLLKRKDGYYTNGIFLQYNWASRHAVKEVNTIEVGQRMYTSRTHFMKTLSEYDRPFAGYLYAKYQRTVFTKKDNAIRYRISLGTIGPNALAKELQTKYHRLISIYKTYGWDVQVQNEIG